jgi:hypothetical protein
MSTFSRLLHTVNSAAKLSDVRLELQRTTVLTPSVSVIQLEILILSPWQLNINQQKNSQIPFRCVYNSTNILIQQFDTTKVMCLL